MKKLLSLLSVITISGSTMPLLLAISPTKKSIDNFISKKDLEEAGPSNRICCDSSDANNSENDENKTIDDLKNLSDLIVFLGLEIKKCKINSLNKKLLSKRIDLNLGYIDNNYSDTIKKKFLEINDDVINRIFDLRLSVEIDNGFIDVLNRYYFKYEIKNITENSAVVEISIASIKKELKVSFTLDNDSIFDSLSWMHDISKTESEDNDSISEDNDDNKQNNNQQLNINNRNLAIVIPQFEQELVNEFHKMNSNLNIERNSVKITANTNKKDKYKITYKEKNKDKEKIFFLKKNKKKLSSFFKIINLGNIENIDNQNNYQEILERFINVNSNNNNIPVELLTLQNLHVIPNSVTENSAIISLSNYGLYGARLNFDYYGAILVTFNTLEQELSICEETNTITKEDSDDDDKQNNNLINIGRINNNSPEEIIPIILNYIKEQHKILINRQSIKIDYIFEDLLEININSIDPEFNITFFIEFDTNFFLVNDIQNIIVTNDLGLLENHEPNEKGTIIINEFMRLNNLNEIESINLTLNNITENTAIISINPRNSSNFFGEVQVNFRLDSNTNQNINQNNVNNQNNFGGSCSGGSSTNKKNDTFFTKDWSSDSDNECEQTNFNNKQFNSDGIEKWYKFLQPDQLKIDINKETWDKEIKPHIQKIINVVGKFPVSDHSSFQKFNEENRNMMVGSIAYNYTKINDIFLKNNVKYLVIDKTIGHIFLDKNFYYTDYYDYVIEQESEHSNSIEKWYKFLQPDQLKIGINKETWNKEIKPHIQKIINVVDKFSVGDHSWFQKFNEENRNTLISTIIRHFNEIDHMFNSNNFVKISTDTYGLSFDIEKNETKNKITHDEL